jgi:hypothetical protein
MMLLAGLGLQLLVWHGSVLQHNLCRALLPSLAKPGNATALVRHASNIAQPSPVVHDVHGMV